jgi:hypothetical protein
LRDFVLSGADLLSYKIDHMERAERRCVMKPSPQDDVEPRIMAALERVYHGNREKIRAFWEAAHPMPGGRSPSAVAGTDAAGAERVLDLIAGFEASFPV